MQSRNSLLAVTLLALLSACKAPEGWLVQIGGANAETVFGIAATDDDRACTTGTFISKVDFGSESQPLQLDSGGYSDIFVACYNSDGSPAFATHFGVTQKNDQPRAIAAMAGGDVLVTGFFSKTFGMAPNPVLQAPGPANADIFLARVDNGGETVWARRYGGLMSDSGHAIAVDANSGIYLAGYFQGLLPVAEGGAGRKLDSAGGRDAFLLKLDDNGDTLWARRFGGNQTDEALAVTVTTDGLVVVAGTFADQASSEGGAALQSAGYNDIFVEAYTPDGVLRWSTAFGGTGQEHVGGLANGAGGSVWFAGSFQNTIAFENGPKLDSRGSTDGLLVRIGPQGRIEKALQFGGAEVELVYGISAAPDNSLWVAGHFQTAADLAPGNDEHVYRAAGTADTDAFIIKLSADGRHEQALIVSGDDVSVANGVAAMPGGGVAATGIFGKQIRVGGQPGATLTSRGKSDVYVLRRMP